MAPFSPSESERLTRKTLIEPKLKAAGWEIVAFDEDKPLSSYDRCAIALAAQAILAFASFEPEPGLKFDRIYELYSQRLTVTGRGMMFGCPVDYSAIRPDNDRPTPEGA